MSRSLCAAVNFGARATRTLVAVLVIAAGLSVAAGSAAAAFPGANGKIVFSRVGDDGNWFIYSMNPDGTGVTKLTEYAGEAPGASHRDWRPSVSPDGTKIVFDRFIREREDSFGSASPNFDGQTHDYELYMVNADGSNETRITRTGPATAEIDASFSPDGKRIVFQAQGGSLGHGSCKELYTMDLSDVPNDGVDPSKWTRVTRGCAELDPWDSEWPAWSPDGTKIAFAR